MVNATIKAQVTGYLRKQHYTEGALVTQGPDLRMQRLPAGLALLGALLCRQGDVVGWHRYGKRPIRQRHGLLALQSIDRVECLAMRAEHLIQGFPEILQQMKA